MNYGLPTESITKTFIIPARRHGGLVHGVHIDALSWDETLQTIIEWAEQGSSKYICACNVHSIISAQRDPRLLDALNFADMATPDGMPIALFLHYLGFKQQPRINGPDLMWEYCKKAEQLSQSIYLYGGTDDTLAKLCTNLNLVFPNLRIAGTYSPPFRTLSDEEDKQIVKMINQSGANVVFICLGCPKQELWMAEHRGRINAVMLGVGAAFAYHAGTIKRAPRWMQQCCLEWLHRLLTEPRRLWRRYLVTNTLFIFKTLGSLVYFRKETK